MTAENLPPWARMALGYDGDPKVSKLARFGEEAGLCRDLHLAMIRYSRRQGTDGWVPVEEVGRLAYPLPLDRALVLVEHLADVELIAPAIAPAMAPAIAPAMAPAMAPAIAPAMPEGWQVSNYAKWQETAAEIAEYTAEQSRKGRRGAETRWTRERARFASIAGGMAPAIAEASPEPYLANGERHASGVAEREVERDLAVPSVTRASGRAGEAEDGSNDQPNEEDELDTLVQALMHAKTGRSVSRIEALSIRQTLLSGRTVRDRAAYIRSALSTKKDARAFLPTLEPQQPPSSKAVLRPRVDRSAAAGRGAAEARRLMAEKAAKDAANEPARQEPEPDPLPEQEPLPVPDAADDPGEPPGEDQYPF